MALTTTTALVIAGTASALGAATSVRQGQLAKEAGQLRQRQADSKASTERRRMVRQDRIKRAQILNDSANQGTQGSSGEAGAIGGITSQTATNLSASNQFQALSQRISDKQQTSTDLGTAGALFNTVGQTASIFT